MTDLYMISTLYQIVILTTQHVHECKGRLLPRYASRLFTASEEACAQKGCHSGAYVFSIRANTDYPACGRIHEQPTPTLCKQAAHSKEQASV